MLHDVMLDSSGSVYLGVRPLGMNMKDVRWAREEQLDHLMVVEYSDSESLCMKKLSCRMTSFYLKKKNVEVLHDSLRVLDYLRFL